MSFTETTTNIRLRGGHVLVANCRDKDGNWGESEIDLNSFIGNEDGKVKSQSRRVSVLKEFLGWFTWGGENFAESASDIQLEGGNYLTADLPMRDGSLDRGRQGIDLNKRIANVDGQLTYTSGAFFSLTPGRREY